MDLGIIYEDPSTSIETKVELMREGKKKRLDKDYEELEKKDVKKEESNYCGEDSSLPEHYFDGRCTFNIQMKIQTAIIVSVTVIPYYYLRINNYCETKHLNLKTSALNSDPNKQF